MEILYLPVFSDSPRQIFLMAGSPLKSSEVVESNPGTNSHELTLLTTRALRNYVGLKCFFPAKGTHLVV